MPGFLGVVRREVEETFRDVGMVAGLFVIAGVMVLGGGGHASFVAL